jgi:hypothetical protein
MDNIDIDKLTKQIDPYATLDKDVAEALTNFAFGINHY